MHPRWLYRYLENMPAQFKVSEESGLKDCEDDEMEILDADAEYSSRSGTITVPRNQYGPTYFSLRVLSMVPASPRKLSENTATTVSAYKELSCLKSQVSMSRAFT